MLLNATNISFAINSKYNKPLKKKKKSQGNVLLLLKRKTQKFHWITTVYRVILVNTNQRHYPRRI